MPVLAIRALTCTAVARPFGVLAELSAVGQRYVVGSSEVVALADASLRVAAEDLAVLLGSGLERPDNVPEHHRGA